MSSVYQSNGKPLSQQALYQQKIRQGIYNSPNGASIGVNTNASDTAALLAASTDLTVRPSYERTIAPEAHTAAIAARKENIAAWSRDSADQSATDASVAATGRSSTLTSQYSGASSISFAGTGIPSLKGGNIYRVANENSTSTMTSRINPEKDVKRIGLVSKQTSSNTLDIKKINQVANKNSTKSLNSRFNPDLDYRSGLKAGPTEYLNQDEEDLAANGAAASLKHGSGISDRYSSQSRSQSFKAVDVVNSTLLAAANKNANTRLQSLSSGVDPKNFKAQAQLYAGALAIAQKNSEARIAKSQAGLIELGGGLTITQAELDNLASLVVQPVLKDISDKATTQRKLDADKSKKQQKLHQAHQESKKEEYAAKLKEKADIEQAKQQRLAENEDKKQVENDKYTQYQTEKNEALQGKVTELKALEQKYAEEKEALLTEKQANQDRIDEEEAQLIAERKQELDDLQAEKDEIINPVLGELTIETKKLKELTDAKDELSNEVKNSEDQQAEYESKLAELQEKLESTKAEIEKYTGDLEEATQKHEETSKEVDELHQFSIDELNKAQQSHQELDEKIAGLEETKAQHLAEKQEKKDLINSEIESKVKEEHQINSELPEHLQKSIDESKLRDTGDLFSLEEKEVPLVSEPEPVVAPVVETPQAAASIPVAKKAAIPIIAASSTLPGAKKSSSSGLKRFSSLFKSSSKPRVINPATAPNKKKKVSAAVVETPVKKEVETAKVEADEDEDIIGSGNGASEADFEGVEESSLIDIGKPKTKGSVFKEEED